MTEEYTSKIEWASGPLSQTYTADIQCVAERTPGGLRTDLFCKSYSYNTFFTRCSTVEAFNTKNVTCQTTGDNKTWFGNEYTVIHRHIMDNVNNYVLNDTHK